MNDKEKDKLQQAHDLVQRQQETNDQLSQEVKRLQAEIDAASSSKAAAESMIAAAEKLRSKAEKFEKSEAQIAVWQTKCAQALKEAADLREHLKAEQQKREDLESLVKDLQDRVSQHSLGGVKRIPVDIPTPDDDEQD